jgi:hypothetical protein
VLSAEACRRYSSAAASFCYLSLLGGGTAAVCSLPQLPDGTAARRHPSTLLRFSPATPQRGVVRVLYAATRRWHNNAVTSDLLSVVADRRHRGAVGVGFFVRGGFLFGRIDLARWDRARGIKDECWLFPDSFDGRRFIRCFDRFFFDVPRFLNHHDLKPYY